MSGEDWTTANQRVLVAEFARLRAQIVGEDTAAELRELAIARDGLVGPSAIDTLCAVFGLSSFERDVLLLCAGVEMDRTVAAACAATESDGRPFATFRLALSRLADPHWSAVAPIRPLRLWRLVDVGDAHGLASSRLSIDERVLHYLAGVSYLDSRLRPLVRAHAASPVLAKSHAQVVAAAVRDLESHAGTTPIVQLTGDDAGGQEEVACRIATWASLRLHVLRGADIPANPHEVDSLAMLWHREAALLNSALLIEANDGAHTMSRFLERSGGLLFVTGRQPLTLSRSCLRFAVDRPSPAEQKELWLSALGPFAGHMNGALDAVAAQFRFTTDGIVRAAATVANGHAQGASGRALWEACRTTARSPLDDLAQRVLPSATWDGLVLPEPQLATLHQIAAQVRQRLKVYDGWGFAEKDARGLGISALFSGESGTGKTMAAEALTNELGLDLYRIDLSAMISKYIGETEKNLRRVFDAAEDSGAILLFDEADALFGRRSEVKDSHDRYANIEVSYLLQRMETYRGLAILTTNIKGALDTSFMRRLRFVVQFPFPDAELRERIWRGVFPAHAPLATLDHRKLAQLNVPGGHIRNIAINAAFQAADSNVPLGMAHLLQAARSEAAKRDRPFSDAETRGWA